MHKKFTLGDDFVSGLKAVATWEVDPTGKVTGIPASMYLVIGNIHLNFLF